ncbi:MAG TPA: ribosome maturation factor RimP [Acidimicrobiales bacterium]|nr:ribosome maturation factor RimP [Acidimicrobiales bacterium]
MAVLDTIEGVVVPVLDRRDLHLYDLEQAGPVLRVLVEGASGVDLDTLTDVSRELSSVLDHVDAVPGRYTLEVSSPGLERPLRRLEHFAGAVGTRIRIKTRPGVDGDRRVEGTLAEADDLGVVVEADSGPRRLAYDEIERARTVFDWGPPAPRPSPSRGKQRKGNSR